MTPCKRQSTISPSSDGRELTPLLPHVQARGAGANSSTQETTQKMNELKLEQEQDSNYKKREIAKACKHEIYNDHFQNYKRHAIPKAQLVIADIPYNLGNNAYASNPAWYKDGDNANGESELAGKEFFDTDKDFRISEFLHFCSKMLKPENKKETGVAPCMIFFAHLISKWRSSQRRRNTVFKTTSILFSSKTSQRKS